MEFLYRKIRTPGSFFSPNLVKIVSIWDMIFLCYLFDWTLWGSFWEMGVCSKFSVRSFSRVGVLGSLLFGLSTVGFAYLCGWILSGLFFRFGLIPLLALWVLEEPDGLAGYRYWQ